MNQGALFPNYALFRIRENCSDEQKKLMEFFENLSPKDFTELKKAKKQYSECIKKTKAQITKEKIDV